MVENSRPNFRKKCLEIELELAAYAAEELSPAARERVKVHLSYCNGCRAELARESYLRQTLGALPDQDPPPELNERIRTAINPDDAKIFRFPHRLTAALAVAAAGLALVILLPTTRPSTAPPPRWTSREIAAGRAEVIYSLALAARVLDQSRKEAVIEVFADQLPRSVNESLKIVKPTTPGGNG